MCLAIPGRVISMSEGDLILRTGRVDFEGIVKEINLAYVPEAGIGDYVLVHVGFAIALIDEAEAGRVLGHLREIGELDESQLAEGEAAADRAAL